MGKLTETRFITKKIVKSAIETMPNIDEKTLLRIMIEYNGYTIRTNKTILADMLLCGEIIYKESEEIYTLN